MKKDMYARRNISCSQPRVAHVGTTPGSISDECVILTFTSSRLLSYHDQLFMPTLSSTGRAVMLFCFLLLLLY